MTKSLKTKIWLLGLTLILVTTTGFRCSFITPGQKDLLEPITLNWWGTFDDKSNFSEIIADYTLVHPNIKIEYRKLRTEEFEQELLDALAEDRGPDIITLHNTWVSRYLSKLEPLPATTKLAYQVTKKSLGIKQETLIEVRESPTITVGQLKNNFIDVVFADVTREAKIYGLPLSIDTLVMLYNKDLFNNAGIPLPPANWSELQEYVKRLTFQDSEGKITQSGVAMGTAQNIEHNFDILSLLMVQNGAAMTIDKAVTFHSVPPGGDKTYNPGPEALRFYTDFATPTKEVYTWDQSMPNSLDAFSQGKVGITFGYQSDIPYIEARRQGKLNYGLAKMPQIPGRPEINYASYWVQTVAKKSKNINEAWDFIQFMSQPGEAKKYLAATGRPTALRALIEEQLASDQLNIFADQLLTSLSWYKGLDSQAAQNAFAEMIDTVILNEIGFDKAAELAARKIQQTL
ncbi:MAG: hypothetical protein A3A24_02475 [Candidatus Buchananbacteria bacterium RIFCSPLOWO2_01_FULL_46_12]|uniref:ABC transporter substrate-binding protein n=1 Tax=Candidatus Buchananbacteria bacterium RIFCSPLOWO2_01_FULL_46_12 TaxID=1797546 RepID=A0A1G1YRS8_9BACT|nr:MAG: hypothetical protein A3A24_02475 [Candidatus Buchananbacteria bacterium RIFCSPLOWO2_01_FULL_46_12]